MHEDAVDRIVEQWATVHPDLRTEPMAVMGRVHRLSASVAGRVTRHFERHGISRGDYDVLASLRRSGTHLTPGQLCSGLMLSSAGVTGRVTRLERAGLLRRRPDPDDGRGVRVELTAAGRRLVDRLVREDMDRQAKWIAALSDGERRTLVRLLSKLQAAVEED